MVSKFLSLLGSLILAIWQLPQLIASWLYIIYLNVSGKFVSIETEPICHIRCKQQGAVTLGGTIFINYRITNKKKTLRHEYGHTVQSLILGPLYLIVIGLPSIIWATLHTYTGLKKYDYYDFYTEEWANKLGDKYSDIK